MHGISSNKRKCPFESPLKKPSGEEKPESSKRPRLCFQKRLFPDEIDKLDQQLTNLTDSIQDILNIKKENEPEEAKKIFEFIASTTSSEMPKEQQLKELGLLYFYIVKSSSLSEMPQENSYIEARYQEISEIALREKRSNDSLCPRGLAQLHPSGRMSYLLRAFARMILLPDGAFNVAGCFAVKELLNTSIRQHLSEEMHIQILSIIEQLIRDPALVELLLKPCPVSAKMNEIICIDLTLKKDVDITPYQVRWHLLITLFSTMWQTDEGNCPAVSTGRNLFRHQPFIILELAREILTKGTFSFEGQEIPILPLLATKRKYEPDFMAEIRPPTARELLSVQLAHETLDIPPSDIPSQVRTLNEYMQSQFDNQTESAKEIVLSLKINLLQQSILSALQFVVNNSMNNGYSSRNHLKDFIENVLSFFSNNLDDSHKLHLFSEKIIEMTSNLLWFVCHREWEHYRDHEKIYFPDQPQGIRCTTEPDSFFTPFYFLRRLCILKNDTLIPIDTISGFISTLLEMVDLAFPDGFPVQEKLKSFLKSDAMMLCIANFVEEHNKDDSSLEGKRYYESDSLFFVHTSGNTSNILHWDRLKGCFETTPTVFKNSNNPGSFLLNICKMHRNYIQTHADFLTHANPMLLIYEDMHAFNLTPATFATYFQSDPDQQLKEKVTERAELLLNRIISWEMKIRIIYDSLPQARAKTILTSISRRECDFRSFRLELSSLLGKDELDLIDSTINNQLSLIHIDDFENVIPYLLHSIGRLEKIEEFCESLSEKIDRETYTPILLAQVLYRVFSDLNYPYSTLNQIECMVRDLSKLPQSIEIGNLNWVKQITEKLAFSYLIIKYDIAKEVFQFYVRHKINETPLDQSMSDRLLNKVKIFYPGTKVIK